MELVFIDIDNTLLDFDEYIRRTMREGFAHFLSLIHISEPTRR